MVGQPHDGVADQLAGAVEGDLAAAVDVDDRDVVADGPLVGLGPLAGREHRRVLEQQDGATATVDDPGMHLALQVPRRDVLHSGVSEAHGPEVEVVRVHAVEPTPHPSR